MTLNLTLVNSNLIVQTSDFRLTAGRGIRSHTAQKQTVLQYRDFRHVIRLLATAYAEKDVAIAAVNQGKVLRILEKPLDGELTRAVGDRFRGAPGNDRARDAGVLQHLHTVAIEDVEGLERLAAGADVERAVGEDAVDVEDREAQPAGALVEIHSRRPGRRADRGR